jgi:hypothetical protein
MTQMVGKFARHGFMIALTLAGLLQAFDSANASDKEARWRCEFYCGTNQMSRADYSILRDERKSQDEPWAAIRPFMEIQKAWRNEDPASKAYEYVSFRANEPFVVTGRTLSEIWNKLGLPIKGGRIDTERAQTRIQLDKDKPGCINNLPLGEQIVKDWDQWRAVRKNSDYEYGGIVTDYYFPYHRLGNASLKAYSIKEAVDKRVCVGI